MKRSAVLLLLASVLCICSAQVTVPSVTLSQLDHKMVRIELTSSAGVNVRFQILNQPQSSLGSPNEGIPANPLSASSGYKPVTVSPIKWVHASKQLYVDNTEMKYNAQALIKKDIFPNYGDLPGAWLSQHGEENWVIMEIPEVHDASSITIWETFNPGGVTRVDISSKTGNEQMVYQTGWRCDNSKAPSGANALTISFSPLPFDAHYVRILVDASEKWRGIDSFEVKGQEKMDTKIPGELSNNVVVFTPNPNKPFGCDEFKYIANGGTGWSASGVRKICYGCPSVSGTLCSGRGTCTNAICNCPQGWAGMACETPLCPVYGGQMCSGRGTCSVSNGVPTCVCPAGWNGKACESNLQARLCRACNDPHYTGFWGQYFDWYNTGEWLMHYDPTISGPILQITMFVYQLFVDGGAVRYGNHYAGINFRQGTTQHDCNFGASGWVSFPNGLTAYTSGWTLIMSVSGLFQYNMDSSCFSITAMIAPGAYGQCSSAGYWTVPGGCSIYHCQACQPDYLLSLMKKSEKISSLQSPKHRAGNGGFPLKFISKLKDEIKSGHADQALKELEIPVTPVLPQSMSTSLLSSKSKIKGKSSLVNPAAGKKLRGSGAAQKKASATQNYVLNMMAVRALSDNATPASVDGEVDPAIKNCNPETLRKVMSLGSCLHLMGTIRFDDCVMDACLLEKNLGLAIDPAVTEATREENMAQRDAKEAVLMNRDLRAEHLIEDKEIKAELH